MESNLQPQPHQYADGSRVLGADGRAIGEVVATYREHLIVERGYFFPTNYYIPFSAVANAGGGDIVLALNGREALAQGWETPPADPVAPPATILPAPPPDPSISAAQGPGRPPRPATAPQGPSVAAAPEPPASGTDLPEAPAAAAAAATALTTMPAAANAAAPDVEATPSEVPTTPAPAVSAPVAPGSDQAKAEDRPDDVVGAAEEVGTKEIIGPPPVVEPVAAIETEKVPAEAAESAANVASVPDSRDEPKVDAVIDAATEPAGLAATPPFVGIPGRRLTDAELWSLLDPKEGEADAAADEATPDGDQPDRPAAPEKPESS